VPKPNGRRHAAEIATMALDLLDHIKKLEIPHLPGIKLKLRIGVHSGKFSIEKVVSFAFFMYCCINRSMRPDTIKHIDIKFSAYDAFWNNLRHIRSILKYWKVK
jgi:hypothetical protein